MLLLEDRQKKKRLADRSDCGWELVREYEADKLADGSEDEKKIRKAEKAAELRIASKKKAIGGRRRKLGQSRPYGTKEPFRPAGGALPFEPRAPYRPWTEFGVNGGRGDKSRLIGPCHRCHEYGHLKYDCRKSRPNKYPLLCGTDSVSYGNSSSQEDMHESDNEVALCVKESVQLHERCEDDKGICVKGCLCSNYDYWETVLRAPEPILSIVRQGYVLPFLSLPEGKSFKNQKSAYMHCEFVTESVADLLKNGCKVTRGKWEVGVNRRNGKMCYKCCFYH